MSFGRAVSSGGSGGTSLRRRGRVGTRACTRDDAGYSLVEAALVLPVLVFLTLLVIQFALLWHARHLAEGAAREGLLAASAWQGTAADGTSTAQSFVAQVAPNQLGAVQVTSSRNAATATVQVSGQVASPFPLVPALQISESASGPVERFVPPAGP